jgi:hypothetical protein
VRNEKENEARFEKHARTDIQGKVREREKTSKQKDHEEEMVLG